jgi:hypothetical protein
MRGGFRTARPTSARRVVGSDRDRGRSGGFDPVQPFERRERVLGGRSRFDRRLQQAARFVAVTALERGETGLQQLLGLALAFGERAARPLDVGTCACMAAVEKQGARPDVDRELVVGGEVMVEADEEELLDLRVAIRCRRAVLCA